MSSQMSPCMGSAGGVGPVCFATESLDMRITQPHRSQGCYISAEELRIQITIANHGEQTKSLLFQDHDESGYHRNFPSGLKARLWNSSGDLLTRNELNLQKSEAEWWTSTYLQSTHCFADCENPGDRVSLSPGQTLKRVISLTYVLLGCPSCGDGASLAPGTYRVQLRLDELCSNVYEFRILEGGETCSDLEP